MIKGKNVLGHDAPYPNDIPELIIKCMKDSDVVLDLFLGVEPLPLWLIDTASILLALKRVILIMNYAKKEYGKIFMRKPYYRPHLQFFRADCPNSSITLLPSTNKTVQHSRSIIELSSFI